jgi:hypothetical protein
LIVIKLPFPRSLLFESGVSDGGIEAGARKQCAALLQGRGPEARPSHFNNNFTLILAKNYDESARRADNHPHGILCSPVDASAPMLTTIVDHAPTAQ